MCGFTRTCLISNTKEKVGKVYYMVATATNTKVSYKNYMVAMATKTTRMTTTTSSTTVATAAPHVSLDKPR